MEQDRSEPWLLALGTAASDGQDLDWEAAEQRTSDPVHQRLVRELRGIAAIARAHRGTGPLGDTPGDVTTPLPKSRVTKWRHLLLFESIGAGAFGTVYRGWDPTVDREVAVKLLSAARTSASPLDEACHLARIRHPNVVTVHGADTDGETAGIWMEFIDGLTLAQLVRERGPMSPREVAGIGLDLCGALSAIHAAGLLHRDIKAQNVIREVGGRIVLMDFSGAHARTRDAVSPVLSGTPLYMASELFTGAPATPASDVYSLGILLFFLLSARLPIEGATMEEVKRAHERGERQRLRDVRADVPDALIDVVERATAPDVSRRFRTAGELQHALASAAGGYPSLAVGAAAAPESAPQRRRRVRLGAFALLIVAAAAAAAFAFRSRRVDSSIVVARFTIGPPYVTGSWPRISPDGRFVVFGAIVEGRNRFWIHPLDKLSGHPLMPTTASETPFWSPDSQTLCYFENDKLKRIAIDGGEPQILADAPSPRGGDWHADNILYSREGVLYRVSAGGGVPQPVTALDTAQGDYQHTWPKFLPDGRRFLYVIRSRKPERTGLYVGSLDGTPPWRLMPAYSRATYADGHLLYVREGSLIAQPIDPRTLSLKGDPITVAGRVAHHARSDAAFDVSSNGALIFNAEGGGPPSTRLVLHDRRGRELEPVTDVGWFARPRFSPDGRRVVAERFDAEERNSELWVFGISPKSATRLTRHPAHDVSPTWSPDGRQIAFSSKRGTVYDVFVKPVDGVEDERLLLSAPGDKYVEHWSPDGKYVTSTVLRSGLWMMPVGGSEPPRQIRAGVRETTWQSEFSPDGRWLAYMSTESGKPEVYVEPFPATGSRWQVSTHGGAEPHWTGDSKELLYLDLDSLLTTVRVDGGPAWKVSPPRGLVPLPVPDIVGPGDYAVSPDGRLLVVNTFVSDPLVPPIEVVVNWQEELKQRVPTR